MKYLIVPIILFVGFQVKAQDAKSNIYTTTSGEIIFSFADINYQGANEGSIMRFSPVFNVQNWVNIDKTDHFGMFTGLSIRNVGFIFDDPNSTTRLKFRTYNLGIPVGIKIGNLSNRFLFAGYELEIPFHYKEKTFIDEEKEDKTGIWFSKRVPTINHSLMAGVQLPYGATLKFKYYLTNFFNKDFTQSDGTQPYAGSDVNIFYFSLSFGLLKNTSFYYKE